MTHELKVTLSTGAVLAVGILIVGAVVAHERLGGWAGASYQARIWYIGHVPPLFWPSEPWADPISFYAPGGEFRVTDPDGYVLMVTHT